MVSVLAKHKRSARTVAVWGVTYGAILVVFVQVACGANWAQISGKSYMNINSVQDTGWEGRWGHSACNFQQQRPVPCDYPEGTATVESLIDSGATVAATSDDQLILITGGDTYRQSDGFGYFRNDVWSAPGVKWATFTSTIEKDKWGRQRPRRRSKTTWKLLSPQKEPPPGVPYRKWTACAASHVNYPGVICDPSQYNVIDEIEFWHEGMKCQCDFQKDPYPGRMFSPRRGHASIAYRRKAYVLGGRARTITDIPYDEAVGGIPVDDHVNQVANYSLRQRYREKVELTNDIWETSNGREWFITTPGCRAESLQQSHQQDNGHERATCVSDEDCYGNELCESGACVCQMWSPREQFAVQAFPRQPLFTEECPATGPESRIYVFGGFSNRYVQRCASNACNQGYTEYNNDVWRTKKECVPSEIALDPTGCRSANKLVGEEWEMVTAAAPWPGRGGHQSVLHQQYVFIIAGETGNLRETGANALLNDVWRSADGTTWEAMTLNAEFSPRKNFNAQVVLSLKKVREGPLAGKKEPFNFEYIFVFGGNDGENTLDDCYESTNGTKWLRDFAGPGQYNNGEFHDGTAQSAYVRGSSDIEKLGMMTAEELQMLKDEGIGTIDDFVNAEKGTIMKLRGGSEEPDPLDGPEQYRGGPFRFVCPLRKRAEAVVQECSVATTRVDGQDPPCPTCAGAFEELWDVSTGVDLDPAVHYGGKTWDFVRTSAAAEVAGDEDGCSPPEWRTEYFMDGPNAGQEMPRDEDDLSEEEKEVELNLEIGGYGCVENATSGEMDCFQGKVNLTCIHIWTPRDFAASVVVQGNMYILGGRISESEFENDVWYRDGASPQTNIVLKPEDLAEGFGSDEFEFQADEPDCIYEYRVFDASNETNLELKRNWTFSLKSLGVHDFLPEWSPKDGIRRIEVRAVDPAGNVDMYTKEGSNTFQWDYLAPIPVALIVSLAILGIASILGSIIEIRRRQKKKAMERYAIKRMRRKFKGAQRAGGKKKGGKAKGAAKKDENVDWKQYYKENKK